MPTKRKAAHRPARDLVWCCERCGRAADVLTIDARQVSYAVSEHRREYAQVRARHTNAAGFAAIPVSEIPDFPDVPWAVVCDACMDDDEIARTYYWIATSRVASVEDALAWTLHLHGKDWVVGTNWDDLMRRVVLSAKGLPPSRVRTR
jgi:hypothetical protein